MTTAAAPSFWQSTSASRRGHGHAYNEDACLERDDVGLWLVSDGMGGHDRGRVASGTIAAALDGVEPTGSLATLLEDVQMRLYSINLALWEEGRRRAGSKVIGATVCALMARGGYGAIVWAGDTRAYRLRDGRLEQLTRDHTVVQDLLDRGDITPEAAVHHAAEHIITRAIGAAESLDLDRTIVEVMPGDRYLLCSDGVCKVVSEETLTQNVAAPFDEVAERIVAAAQDAGSRDDVTAVVVEFGQDA
jgi:serine/threonine protein phosphatase PrpC